MVLVSMQMPAKGVTNLSLRRNAVFPNLPYMMNLEAIKSTNSNAVKPIEKFGTGLRQKSLLIDAMAGAIRPPLQAVQAAWAASSLKNPLGQGEQLVLPETAAEYPTGQALNAPLPAVPVK